MAGAVRRPEMVMVWAAGVPVERWRSVTQPLQLEWLLAAQVWVYGPTPVFTTVVVTSVVTVVSVQVQVVLPFFVTQVWLLSVVGVLDDEVELVVLLPL